MWGSSLTLGGGEVGVSLLGLLGVTPVGWRKCWDAFLQPGREEVRNLFSSFAGTGEDMATAFTMVLAGIEQLSSEMFLSF